MSMIFLIIYSDEGLSNLSSYKNDSRKSDDLFNNIKFAHREINKSNRREGRTEIRYNRMVLCFSFDC